MVLLSVPMTGTGLSLGNHTSFFFDRNLKTSPVADGDCLALKLSGNLQDGSAIEGEDVVLIRDKDKEK